MTDVPPDAGEVETTPPPLRHPHSFRAHLVRALPVIVLVAVLTWILSHFGFLRPFETAALDSYLRLKAPLRSEHVVIVGIDECDYRELFGATSPLDPDVLARLLDAIVRGQPRMVVVDLDTAHERFNRVTLPRTSLPIVWARGASSADGLTAADCAKPAAPSKTDAVSREFVPASVLGGSPANRIQSGLAVLPRDADGVIRRYYREVETSEGRLPTLAWAASQLDGGNLDGGEHHEAFVLNFAGDRFAFPRISAGDTLRVAEGESWAAAGPLRGKIVLLGGFYRAARDEYVTPVGLMSGVELVAQAIESELTGGGIRPANEVAMIVLELLGGVLLVWLHHRFRLGVALALSILAMPFLSVVFSWLAFSSAALWANFIPILASVLVHQLYDHARMYRALYLKAGVPTV